MATSPDAEASVGWGLAILDGVEAAAGCFDLLVVGEFLFEEGGEVFSFWGGLVMAYLFTWSPSDVRAYFVVLRGGGVGFVDPAVAAFGGPLPGEVFDQADDLAKRFEDYEPRAGDERDPASLEQLRDAVHARSAAERAIRDAVAAARSDGQSWAAIGSMLGTSSEAARQRYGHPQTA